MKYLKKFDSHEQYLQFIESNKYLKPSVSLCKSDMSVHMIKRDKYSRLNDDGFITSYVYEDRVYFGDLPQGEHTFTVTSDNFIYKDYFESTMGDDIEYEIVNVIINGKQLTVTFSTSQPYSDAFMNIKYSSYDKSLYEIVHISVETSDENAKPQFARIKYNKSKILQLSSDDQGLNELVNQFAFFNGYHTPTAIKYSLNYRGDDFLIHSGDYINEIVIPQGAEEFVGYHKPLTYSDDTGAVRRYVCQCAILEEGYNSVNYMWTWARDFKMMKRMRWGYSIHDVKDISSVSSITDHIYQGLDKWESVVPGINIKTMIEPNGNKDYVAAAIACSGMCMSLCQNASQQFPAVSKALSGWLDGSTLTGFKTKPNSVTERWFTQGEQWIQNKILNSDGSEILFVGNHGYGVSWLGWLSGYSETHDDMWVATLDELWEYYHSINESYFDNITHKDGVLSFDVIIPRYMKSRFFGELTINIPITDGNNCILSDNVIIGGYRQNNDKYTINIGLHDDIYTDIEELTQLYKNNPTIENIKNDAQYLINMLAPGSKKIYYNNELNE